MDRTKYPRTMNLPWSGSESSDDVWWDDTIPFNDKEVIVTEKLDGECTSIYPDGHIHARSIDTRHHDSRSWVKQLAARIAHDIPEHHRICGENVFAWHSIFYTELPTYFFVYGIYQGDLCLPWDEVEEICELLDLQTVPVIYRGLWDENKIRDLTIETGAFPTFSGPHDGPCNAEGYVVRVAKEFLYDQVRE